ncbi:DUF6796 family protein [Bacteroides heparinolyticus]|uniref:DUF6796 family protein n=2 Tax=Prevotella heparinolytica TaxID=28113 RepID=UPI0035A0711D
MFQKTINPKTARQILPAVYAGLLASLCWIAGDILILGFTPNPAKYPLLSETYAFQINVDIATLMLSGSTSRLMWGALLAVFSMPLYLYGIFAVSRLIKRKFMMPVFLLLFIGRSLSPLGHAAFFYVGEIYKTILDTDPSAHARLLETALAFEKILKIVWTASVSFTTLGWLLSGVWVVQEKTVLKKSAVWFNPIVFVVAIALLWMLLPSPMKDWIGCAVFNEANLIFFAILLFIVQKRRNPTNGK